jgi:hypothetical protein
MLGLPTCLVAAVLALSTVGLSEGLAREVQQQADTAVTARMAFAGGGHPTTI